MILLVSVVVVGVALAIVLTAEVVVGRFVVTDVNTTGVVVVVAEDSGVDVASGVMTRPVTSVVSAAVVSVVIRVVFAAVVL